jgi:hypothetical protein
VEAEEKGMKGSVTDGMERNGSSEGSRGVEKSEKAEKVV